MMSAINKIHFNGSTGVSLNDRFTIMSKMSPLDKPAAGRERNNGGILRKRSNSVDSFASRNSYANRQLVNQLDRRHLGQSQAAALRLRNKTIRSGRQRLNRTSLASRTQLRRAAGNTLSLAGGSRRLQRSNSFSDIATMNADFVERQSLRRSNSQLSIASRLGNAGRSRGGPRRPLQRTNSSANLSARQSPYRGRSRSRSRSRARLPRSRSRGNLPRARSRSAGLNGFGNGFNNNNNNNNIESRLGRAGATGGRIRGRSNVRRGRGRAPAALSRSASRTNLRSGSVNGRLGGNRTNRPLGTRGGRGRVAKRGQRRGPAGTGQNGTGGGGGRPGRTLQRRGGAATQGAGPGRRGRSRSRGRAASQNRGRSAQRGRNASKGRRASAPAMSKEQLDNELDQYMANTKSSLDREMDEYMNGINSTV
ncbi:chromatin target of PRMT1 protein [Aedes albopictus]|uniref:Chromatin target of PRMT1 protein C-terminal domain-containing protein n=1 Tax=Aedes albopictus TaxID=7160 RepID=A0ABM1Y6Z4_AEDAL